MTLSIAPPNSSVPDVEELIARVAELERAQRSEDVEGFLALFDDEAVWVSAGGVRLIGRDAISEFTRKVLPEAFSDGSVRYDVDHIRFVTPDIALTGVNQEYLTAEGEVLVPRQEGRPSYVWQRKNRQWLIVCGQNTSVPVNRHSY